MDGTPGATAVGVHSFIQTLWRKERKYRGPKIVTREIAIEKTYDVRGGTDGMCTRESG